MPASVIVLSDVTHLPASQAVGIKENILLKHKVLHKNGVFVTGAEISLLLFY